MKEKTLTTLLIIIPLLVESSLSIISEINYYRVFVFIYPFYFAGLLIYFLIRKQPIFRSIMSLGISLITHFLYGYFFYAYQQRKIAAYTESNNLGMAFDGFTPYIIGLVVNVILLLGLITIIYCVRFIINNMKRKQRD